MEFEEFSKKLKNKARYINVELNEEQLKSFYLYMNLLLEGNEKINLTAITEPNEVILKHFIDCLSIEKYISEPQSIVDVGTGAGFPGIPLNILKNKSEITLLDSLNKRITFLNEVIKELNLKNINTVHARAEEFARNKKYREKFDIATSRAVAPLNILLEYLVPLVKVNGICICMKGSNTDEIEKAKTALKILGAEIEKVENLTLPESDITRNIIIIRKIKETPIKYPRKAGIPSKEPLWFYKSKFKRRQVSIFCY